MGDQNPMGKIIQKIRYVNMGKKKIFVRENRETAISKERRECTNERGEIF